MKIYILLLLLFVICAPLGAQTRVQPKESPKKDRISTPTRVDPQPNRKTVQEIRKRQVQRPGYRIKAKKGTANRPS